MMVLDFKVVGSGVPIVFFNGFRMHYESWDSVYTAIEKSNKVILYNRSGVGASPRASRRQTAKEVVEAFEALMLELSIHEKIVIVAHSLGGLYANYFSRIHPEKVLGLVLVESPHPLEIEIQKNIKIPFLINIINESLKKVEKLFDPYKFSEDECINDTLFDLKNAPAFPDVPVAIVTGTKKMPFVPELSFSTHTEYQKKLLQLSPYSKQFLCESSGHFPQITEPFLVVSAIEYILHFHKA